jgi:SSS family solute:Na+ symporter
MHLALISAVMMLAPTQLTHLGPVDIAILLMYFAMVIFIGFYVKGSTNTSEQFFLAGREMTAWIAGLSFVSANLGSLELMGWAGAAYQYGILATHWYWIGAIPAMLFLGIVMMPFYYISKTHSVPGYLQLRFGEGARGVSGVCFAFMTILMSGVNMYAMAAGDAGGPGLEHRLLHVGGRHHRGDLRDAGRAALGHHQRGAAVRPDLGGRNADPHPGADRSRRLAPT